LYQDLSQDEAVFDIDPASPVPPFEQVRSGFAERISNRSLAVGTKLPTVRALAATLNLAPNTVARAYRELEESGLVETRGRAGTFVSAAGSLSRVEVQRAARAYVDLARSLGISDAEALDIVTAAFAS
jgi:DNA-binding transcriptional regulator YhcF (GntR family)